MILSVVHPRLGSNVEVDNPNSDDDVFLAKFIPADIAPLVKATQIIALLAYVIFADSSLKDVATAVNLFPPFSQITKDDKMRRLVFSAILRGTQGILATLAVLLLVITSTTVIDIILNFTAIGFLSRLDDVAFELAESGRFGPVLEAEVIEIVKLPLPKCVVRTNKHIRYFCTVIITGIILIGLAIAVLLCQNHKEMWTTTTLRVQFQGKDNLEMSSGCYKLDKDSDRWDNRHGYNNVDKDKDSNLFGFCHNDRRWVLFKNDNNNTPCSRGELMHSTKTDTYDISSSFDEPWYSSTGEPIPHYFFEESNVNESECLLYLNDGNCDSSFNNIDYQYDGGDCCAATCNHPSCGIGGLTSVFGNTSNFGDGFSDCQDPSMIPITIRFDSIFGSNNAEIYNYYTDYYKDYDIGNANDDGNYIVPGFEDIIIGNNTDHNDDYLKNIINNHINKEPVNPLMFLDCQSKNMITIYIDKSMERATETVMVEDAANCAMTIMNSTGDTEFCDKSPILYINYTIFRGDKTSIQQDPIVIASIQTNEQNTISFRVVPKCYYEKLLDYVDNTTMYTGTTPANKAINWLMDEKSGNILCESPFFIQRYALAVLSFSAPAVSTISIKDYSDGNNDNNYTNTTINEPINNSKRQVTGEPNDNNSWSSSTNQCVWPQIICIEGVIMSIKLIRTKDGHYEGSIATEIGLLENVTTLISVDNDLIGTIPSEIGLLTRLTNLDLWNNDLTGTIPMEIGVLTGLTNLDLWNNSFTGTIPSEIGSLTGLTDLDLRNNGFTGTIPSEIGSLTRLTNLDLAENDFTGNLPSEFGSLTGLVNLNLWENDFSGNLLSVIGSMTGLTNLDLWNTDFNGTSIPSEIGLLKGLTDLALSLHNFTGTLPSEIGLLIGLTDLDLRQNNFTGTIPREIGSLIGLTNLDLYNMDFTGSLPTEIGLLTVLSSLDLAYNDLSSTIPSEIGLLTALTNLDLHDNDFTGTIPTEILLLTGLNDLSLEDNDLTGTVPSEIGLLTGLESLFLTNNGFSGTIPNKIGSWTDLNILDLSTNDLSGTIPIEIGSLTGLTYLDLENNGFTGTLPNEIVSLTGLVNLNLKGNAFIGSLTSEIESLTGLVNLDLFDNTFTGTIPSEIGLLTGLTSLEFGDNELEGIIPREIGLLTGLNYLDLGRNVLTGNIPGEIRLLTGLTALDLRQNDLTGTIPSEIGSLTGLANLNLSYNYFTGTIPSEIGLLTGLENLSLDYNDFTGTIPSEIGLLTGLTDLRLTFNLFSGSIPSEVEALKAYKFTEVAYQKDGTSLTRSDETIIFI